MDKEKILEILKDSKVFKIANLSCFHTNSNILIYSNDLKNSKVFETKLLELNDRFALNSFCDKTNFLYEYIEKDDLLIETVNLKTFYETLEVLSVKQNKNLTISINITDNKDKSTVISIGSNNLSFITNDKDTSVKLCIDLDSKDIIKYQERNKNETFNLKVFKEKKKTLVSSYSTIDSKIVKDKIELKEHLYLAIYDFISNNHIRYVTSSILSTFDKKIDIECLKCLDSDIFMKLSRDKCFQVNGMLSKIIDERKVLDYNTYKIKSKNLTE